MTARARKLAPGETPETRFADLQVHARVTRDAALAVRGDLNRRYTYHGYAKAAERKRLERLQRAADRAQEAFTSYLCTIAPAERDWYRGVPLHWLIDSLTYADAVTRDALSVVPPAAYGYAESWPRMFARAIGPDRAVQP
jgi:hypothetical protein